MNSRTLAAALIIATLAAAGGCADSDPASSAEDSRPGEYLYSGASVVAVDSAANAKTWSDTVVVFTVVSERKVTSGTPEAASSPITGRRVTVDVDRVVWARKGGAQPPESFEIAAAGWYDVDGTAVPMRSASGIRLEVGRTYVAPLLYLFGEWGFDDSVLEVVDGRISPAPQQDFALATELGAKSIDEAASVLGKARPLPQSGALRDTTQEQLAAVGVDAR